MAVYHCTLRGTLFSGTLGEEFSHSMGFESQAPQAAVAQALHDAWQTMWNGTGTIANYYNAQTAYTECTAAAVLDPMVPDLAAATHVPFTPNLAGSSSANNLPTQSAVVVSLTAGTRPNGRPFKGRFYLPAPVVTYVTADGGLDATNIAIYAEAMAAVYDAMFLAGHAGSVWSRTVEDLVNPVEKIRVGNKIDTMRSRRNRFPETYHEVVLS